MPRNGSGTYTLPSGNPVSPGTLVDATWANNTLNDIANELTDSLSRSGEGGMLAPFRLADGSQSTPGVAWTNEPSTGFYRAGSNDMWAVVGGTQITQFTSTGMLGRFAAGAVTTPSVSAFGDTNTGIYFPGADELGLATGGVLRLSIDSVGAVAIPGSFSVTGNVTIDTNTLFVDAANNRVGVGTVTPAVKLDVAGGISIGSADNLTWGGAYGATTPAISGAAGFLAFYPNGSTSGEQLRLTATALGVGTATPTFGSGSGIEIERAGIATLRLENSSASNSFELYADSAANGINLRGRDSSPMNFWTANTQRGAFSAAGTFTVNAGAVINEDGGDNDTRIEGDTDANLVFVDASADKVGIGKNNPVYKLDVSGAIQSSNGGNENYFLNDGTNRSSIQVSGAALYFNVNDNLSGQGTAIWRSSSALTERMRLDASGNLGLGVTPPAASTPSMFSDAGVFGGSSESNISNNATFNSGWKYINTAGATRYQQVASEHRWFNAPSGTAGNAISFTQAMTLDASGILSLGVSGARLSFTGTSGDKRIGQGDALVTGGGSTDFAMQATNAILFATGGTTERARITAGGRLTVKTSTYDNGIVTADNSWDPASASWATLGASFAGVGSYGGGMLFIDSNTAGYALWTQDSGKDFYIKGNTVGVAMTGGVYLNDYATSWSSASDENVKDIIEPIENAIEKVVTLRTVIGKYKDEAEGKRHPFLIAQDVEKVLPEAVSKMNKGQDNECLGLSYTDTIPLLVAAIKEQQAMIEELKAKVAALEAK